MKLKAYRHVLRLLACCWKRGKANRNLSDLGIDSASPFVPFISHDDTKNNVSGHEASLLLSSVLGTLAVGNVTLGNLERLAHIAPIPHVQSHDGLLGDGILTLLGGVGTNDGTGNAAELLGLLLGPDGNARRSLLDEEAKVEDVLHGLREGLGIEQMLDSIDLISLRLELLLLAPLLLGVQGVLLLLEGLVRLGVGLVALLVQDLVDDGHIPLDGGKLVGIGLLLLLVQLLGLFLLFVGLLLDDTPLALLALLGDVHDVDGAVEEGDTGGDGIEANSGLPSERPPIEVRVGAGFGRQLSAELLDESGRVVARNLTTDKQERDQIHQLCVSNCQ